MISELLNLLGMQKEIENDFRKMKEFPKTLSSVGCVSLLILILNTLFRFISINKMLSIVMYTLCMMVLLCAMIINFKNKKDFEDARKKIAQKFWESYKKVYEKAIKNGIIEDVVVNVDENKLSRKLDFMCVDQEITENMIAGFVRDAIDSERTEEEILQIYKKYPIENWDFYQIYGLEKAYIANNRATLFMKNKLPSPDNQTEENIRIISMYLNAIKTLTKPEQKVYKKDLYERKVIDVDKKEDIKETEKNEINIQRKDEKIDKISEQLENLDDEDVERLMEQLSKRKKKK